MSKSQDSTTKAQVPPPTPIHCLSLWTPEKPLDSQESLSSRTSHRLSLPRLTNGTQSDEQVLPGAYVLVVGPIPVHVGSAVDQPGDVEGDGVAEDGSQEVGVPQTLPPEAPGHHRGDQEAHERHGDLIVPARQNVMLAPGPADGPSKPPGRSGSAPAASFHAFCMETPHCVSLCTAVANPYPCEGEAGNPKWRWDRRSALGSGRAAHPFDGPRSFLHLSISWMIRLSPVISRNTYFLSNFHTRDSVLS